MKFLRLSTLVLTAFLLLTACKRDTEFTKITEFRKNNIAMTGALNVPQTPSTALGNMDIWYSRETRILTYTLNWSGLSDSVTTIGLMGPAPSGFATSTSVQNLSFLPSGSPRSSASGSTPIIRCPTVSRTSCGSYRGTLLIDGFVATEQNLLAGVYYVTLRTTGPFASIGEIRGQIKFD
ncbi:MAG: CHRD domain-containing protein [Bacteroidota bacterium]|jgi:hypothetical protein